MPGKLSPDFCHCDVVLGLCPRTFSKDLEPVFTHQPQVRRERAGFRAQVALLTGNVILRRSLNSGDTLLHRMLFLQSFSVFIDRLLTTGMPHFCSKTSLWPASVFTAC